MEEIVTIMEERYGKSERIWVMDRGMSSADNIEFLKEGNRRYIIGTSKGMPYQEDTGGVINVESLNRVSDAQMRLDIGISKVAYDQVQRLESFHRLPHHPRLLELYQTLFDSPILVHPRHIMRVVPPPPGDGAHSSATLIFAVRGESPELFGMI